MKDYTKKSIKEFLIESNAVECVYSKEALEDSLKAWDYAFKNRDNFNVNYVLEIHRLLMKRLYPECAGKFRDCSVWIGGEKKKNYGPIVLEQMINNWCEDFKEQLKYSYGIDDSQKDLMCENNHINFENIHPYIDGNGRTGRLLWNIQRYILGLPIKIIHEGDEQYDYYQLFRK